MIIVSQLLKMDNIDNKSSLQKQALLEEMGKEDVKGFNHTDSIFRNHPLLNSNCISKIFFSWVFPVIKFGRENHFKPEHLGEIYQDLDAKTQYQKLKENWKKYQNQDGLPILKCLATTFGWDLFIAFLINFFMILSRISIPFLIIFIVKYMSAPSGEDGGLAYGVYLLSGYVIITGSTFILNQQAQFIQTLVGEKAFGSLT